MNNKYYLLIISLWLMSFSASYGCDVCGCSLGGGYYGILPQFSKNFFGVRWSQSQFYAHMNHQSEYLGEEYSYDTYNKMELWGRFFINDTFQVFTFIPYSYNTMRGSEQNVTAQGLGDITLLLNYVLFNSGNRQDKNIKQTLILGGGLKLPSGSFSQEDQGKLINPNFQMGTGSTDFLFSSLYTLLYKKGGLNIEAGYKINTTNKNKYQFGNQFHSSMHFFYLQQWGGFRFLPNAGLYYEQSAKHKEGNIIQPNTGGSVTLFSTGIESYFKRFTLGINYKHPISQHFNTDEIADIEARDRWTLTLMYNL